ncbi:type VII secretion-associated protein [Mycobacterium noviomagense]|uniref:Type VII secretion-associated protein n=1 Tax=Mycobacterium noviomagense TaxID=459858 RepID=A0A7I7PFJ6_9MYCO|nr:type VII secretion-associated protein [Mycobacterium noviomagense]
MTAPAIIEAGPATVRRLDCATPAFDGAMAAAALDAIDDQVVLVDDQPVSVDSLWRTVLQSVLGGPLCRVAVVHPSWWAASRVDVVNAAAQQLADSVVVQPRSWLLSQASPDQSPVIVEIAERFVVITAAAVVAEARRGQPDTVAESVTRAIAGMATKTSTAVIDAPTTIAGAATLASMIADGLLRSRADLTVVQVDDARLKELAVAALSVREEDDAPARARGGWGRRKRVAAAVLVTAAASGAMLAVGIVSRHSAPPPGAIPTTFLVEGRVALSVPAQWRVERVVGGPGSARVQLTSPSDPEVALHVTQSPVGHETLTAAAESLKRAIDAEPSGVFIDFSPSGTSAGRPAVTYREVRPGHEIRWTVLLDGPVRISIGCQSRAGGAAAILDVCEQAVRSAHAVTA